MNAADAMLVAILDTLSENKDELLADAAAVLGRDELTDEQRQQCERALDLAQHRVLLNATDRTGVEAKHGFRAFRGFR
jgi:hypothetical protein